MTINQTAVNQKEHKMIQVPEKRKIKERQKDKQTKKTTRLKIKMSEKIFKYYAQAGV